MTEQKNSFIRVICQSCGAPLHKTGRKGEFICQYCGAVYHDSNNQDVLWEENATFSEVETPQSAIVSSPVPENTHSHITIPVLGWLLVGFTLLGCLIFTLLSGVLSTNRSFTSAVKKPVMLSVLPSAEKVGKSVAYAGWEIVIDPEIKVHEDKTYFTFTVKNWNDSQQVLHYEPKTLVVYDDLGNTYPLHLGSCEADLPYLERQILFEAYQKTTFSSEKSWCNQVNCLPTFFGKIPINAKHLYLHLDRFGVFENITFVFDL
ncbi:MAG: hypothetical protein GYA48_03260 [Chloroflexi bacterium]|nr:hypothetical protein [Chloroflexota bacterium]